MSLLDQIIRAFVVVVEGLLSLLPAFSMPALPDAGESLGGALGWANAVFPVTVLAGCIGAVMALWVGLLAWDAAVWIYEHLPFIN